MGRNVIPDDEWQRTVEIIEKHIQPDGTFALIAAAAEAGIPRNTMQNRYYRYKRLPKAERIEYPAFHSEPTDEEEPVTELLDRLSRSYERRKKAATSREWFSIRVNETRPYGVLIVGDPHLGDPGCNLPLLRRHMEIAQEDGIYAISMGDVNNRWVGKLVRKYADQETTRTQEERLAEWLLSESGATWLVWVLGNHDMWDGGVSFFKRLCAGAVPMLEWKAQFHLVHPSGSRATFDLSHGRKGNSIWNELHGTLRDAKLAGPDADIFASAHTHNYSMQQIELPKRQRVAWLVQVSGYKSLDSYSRDHGFSDYEHGSSVLAIIDPERTQHPIRNIFADVEEGAEYLRVLRS